MKQELGKFYQVMAKMDSNTTRVKIIRNTDRNIHKYIYKYPVSKETLDKIKKKCVV